MQKIKYILFFSFIYFMALSSVHADVTCTYKNASVKLNCRVSASNVDCYSNNNISTNNIVVNLKPANYNDKGEYKCSKVPIVYIGQVLDPKTGRVSIYDVNSSDNNCPIAAGKYNELSGTNTGGGCVVLKGEVNIVTPENPDDPNPVVDPITPSFNPESFCTGKIEGVFTTLGWAFFVIKILVPIILIIFGSIDFFKAIISSKDDEVKKAAKSLAIRAIAGIVIFFIPTILSFVVSLVDKDDIYEGSFANCTKCMLDPNHEFSNNEVCSGLMSGGK